MPPIITLTTDFGLADPYVGALKGVILSLNRDAVIVDVSHGIQPQQVEQGAFVLGAAWPYFPPGTIHVAVVDPGVGMERRAIALETASGVFIGPDNGVLSCALPDEVREPVGNRPGPVRLPPGVRAFELADARFWRHPVSRTFHGRDVFAPAAAHLTLGVNIEEFGSALPEIMLLPPFRATIQQDGALAARVVHIDHFGNVITTACAGQLPSRVLVDACGRRLYGLAGTYGEGGGLIALAGSSGFVEIALPNGSAARALGARIGDAVTIRPLADAES